MNLLAHLLGLDNGSGPIYLFWSGFGSDLTEIGLLFGIYTLYRRANCGVKGCWRIGLRKVPGTEHVVCHRHHPEAQPDHDKVLADHRNAR